MKESYDGAEPSGNSVSVRNFLRLGRMLNATHLLESAEKTMKFFGKTLEAQGSAMPYMLKALEMYLQPPEQLVICGTPNVEDTTILLREANSRYLPHLEILFADCGKNQQLLPGSHNVFKDLQQIDGKATAYLCIDYSCQMPTNDATKLSHMLEKMK